jgi:hypothetical protein
MLRKVFDLFFVGAVAFFLLFPMFSSGICVSVYEHGVLDEFSVIPKNPEIIVYRCNGFSVVEEKIRLSRGDAYKLKFEYEAANSFDEKKDILGEYGIFSMDDTLLSDFKQEPVNYQNTSVYEDSVGCCFLGFIDGELTGLTISLPIGLGIYPFIIFRSSGPSELLMTVLAGIPMMAYCEDGLEGFIIMFFGGIIMIPFIDPDGGMITGFAIFGIAGPQGTLNEFLP